MRLLELAGIRARVAAEDVARVDGAETSLLREAADFVAAGGTVTLSEWADLSAPERAALLLARRANDDARVAALALAIQDPRVAVGLLESSDGGAMRRQLALHDALSAAIERLRAEPAGDDS